MRRNQIGTVSENRLSGRNPFEQRLGLLQVYRLEPLGETAGPDMGKLAERVGFEPTVQFPAHTLSKRAP